VSRISIIDACEDENLFLPYLGNDLKTWRRWLVMLRTLYGLHPRKWTSKERKLIKHCTGRDASTLPTEGFATSVCLTGRRSGKSRIAAVIGAYEAVLAGHESKLSPGETGVVPIISPTKHQSRIVKNYLRAIFDAPLLRSEVAGETREGFELKNGTRIEILAGDWRTIRGFTLLAAVIDEACFFQYEADSKVRSDTELVRAIQPSLATVGGRLSLISSPYAKKGYCYQAWKKNFGNDTGRTLVWNCSSRTMNPTLPQSVVDDAMAEDLQAAKSEYLGEFRDDVVQFLDRALIEQYVIPHRSELQPRRDRDYFAFADLSGGRGDDAALAIAHRDSRKLILDFVRRWRPPFDPRHVCEEMVEELKRFSIRRVRGDNYAAEFVAGAFRSNGVRYTKSELPASGLYLELLPRLCSGEIELLDNETLIAQLAGLERKTRSGGKDKIDHPSGGHDDVANAVAGVCVSASKQRQRVGAPFQRKVTA